MRTIIGLPEIVRRNRRLIAVSIVVVDPYSESVSIDNGIHLS